MNRPTLLSLALLFFGCASDAFTKADARQLVEEGDTSRDFCADFAWYGDGECDDFCRMADSDCGGCIVTGCSGQLCADEALSSTCEFLPEYACYREATCERQADGACGWTETDELRACLMDPEPEPEPEPDACRATGCSGQICADTEIGSTCEFLPEYACYQELGTCERQADGACGWTETDALLSCIDDAR